MAITVGGGTPARRRCRTPPDRRLGRTVLPPLQCPRFSDPPRREEQEQHDVADRLWQLPREAFYFLPTEEAPPDAGRIRGELRHVRLRPQPLRSDGKGE